ncbi:MAG: ATP-binding cassette domain-containing protein, partial [Syntrophales bacterium]|nr:ATP-binding cassette domain-containing protein [Syntrophales bacterium]
LDGVSFVIKDGETLGLVGESGCGKSTLGRIIVRLETPTAGKVVFAGKDVHTLVGNELKTYRRMVQIIFQDPFAALNPRKTAGAAVEEPLIVHGMRDSVQRRKIVTNIFDGVGLTREAWNRYPHEFSGGQRQRLCIARALVLNPRLVVADEPVSALDVSIQAQILNLMKDLQQEFSLTYLFISHDLSVIRFMSDRIAVMYMGKVVEIGENSRLYEYPCHPYTRLLLDSVPVAHPKKRRDKRVPQEPPENGQIPVPITACPFYRRCNLRLDICAHEEPSLREVGENHLTACHRYGQGDP